MAEELKQWEYRVVASPGNIWSGPKEEDLEALLNELGMEGWEVVSTYTITYNNKFTLIAKRPLSAKGRRQRSWPG